MTVLFSETFSSFLVEDDYFFTFYQRRNYFANNFCAFYSRKTYSYVSFVVNQENFFKFNCCTAFCVLDVVNEQFFASFCFELLTVNFYNCVHLI